jgi:CBS domain-containing protein
LALREGVEETSTLERIRVLHDQGVLGVSENDDLVSAFYLITDIMLRKQIRDYKAGRRVNYFVDPDTLTKRDRVLLLESLKSINNVRKRVHLEFTAEIF